MCSWCFWSMCVHALCLFIFAFWCQCQVRNRLSFCSFVFIHVLLLTFFDQLSWYGQYEGKDAVKSADFCSLRSQTHSHYTCVGCAATTGLSAQRSCTVGARVGKKEVTIWRLQRRVPYQHCMSLHIQNQIRLFLSFFLWGRLFLSWLY